jgi:hypothetical protein
MFKASTTLMCIGIANKCNPMLTSSVYVGIPYQLQVNTETQIALLALALSKLPVPVHIDNVYVSKLSLQVLGNAKGVVAVVVSILIFHNPITMPGLMGYLVCVGGVFWYGRAKQLARQQPKAPLEEETPLKAGV